MENEPIIKNIVRLDQVYAVGGTFKDPSEFNRAVNRNLVVLNGSDKNCKQSIFFLLVVKPKK